MLNGQNPLSVTKVICRQSLTQKMIALRDLLLKRSPEVFFLGSEYLQSAKGSGGNISKKLGNIKSFVFAD